MVGLSCRPGSRLVRGDGFATAEHMASPLRAVFPGGARTDNDIRRFTESPSHATLVATFGVDRVGSFVERSANPFITGRYLDPLHPAEARC